MSTKLPIVCSMLHIYKMQWDELYDSGMLYMMHVYKIEWDAVYDACLQDRIFVVIVVLNNF